MNIKLIFEDWRKNGKSVYNTVEGLRLTKGSLHHGTTWGGTIDFDFDDEAEIKEALSKGYKPVFIIDM